MIRQIPMALLGRSLRNLLILLLVAHLAVTIAPANAEQPFLPGNAKVKARFVTDVAVLQPANSDADITARIGVHLVIEDGWHIYWENSGESGSPTLVKWHVPNGWKTSPVRYPVPLIIEEKGELHTFGYENETVLLSELIAPPIISNADEQITLTAEVSWLVCKDICLPGQVTLEQQIRVSASAPLEPSKDFALISEFDARTPKSPTVLQAFEKTKNAIITPILSTSGLRSGTTHELGIHLANLPAGLSPAQLQVVPKSSDGIEFGLANIVSLGASRCEIAGCGDYLVVLPLRILPGTGEGSRLLSGIIIFAPTVADSPTRRAGEPIAVNWALSSNVISSEPAQNPAFRQLASNGKNPTPLTYRLISHEGSAQAAMDVKNTPAHFGSILFFAFLAGIILNFMPCVLPVISIKVLGLVEQCQRNRRSVTAAAMAYAGGILSSMMLLALTVVILRRLGHLVGWGFQFQQPAFVVVLLITVFLLSLGLFDVVHFQLPGVSRANKALSGLESSYLSDFFDGVLATALSTPCSAPFLGTALAFAFAQPAPFTFSVFAAIGIGLALPYVLIVTRPSLHALLPRPGEWMNHLRQLMGFLLLGTVIWLLFVLHRQTEEGVIWALVLLLVFYFAIWLDQRIEPGDNRPTLQAMTRAIIFGGMIAVAGVLWPMISAPRRATADMTNHIGWEPFSETRLNELIMSGQSVFLDFTADWCVTCKVNEHLFLDTDDFAALLATYHVVAMQADWTRADADVTNALKRYGGQGVPHYVLLSPSRPPKTLPTILSTNILEQSFREQFADATVAAAP